MDWDKARGQVAAVIAERPGEYTAATVANLEDLLSAIRAARRPPPEISGGYWPTFILEWDGAPDLQVEVFDDRYEIAHVETVPLEVDEILHRPGEPAPDGLLALLPAAS